MQTWIGGAKGNGKTGLADGQRRKLRRRTISGSKTEDHMSNTVSLWLVTSHCVLFL